MTTRTLQSSYRVANNITMYHHADVFYCDGMPCMVRDIEGNLHNIPYSVWKDLPLANKVRIQRYENHPSNRRD